MEVNPKLRLEKIVSKSVSHERGSGVVVRGAAIIAIGVIYGAIVAVTRPTVSKQVTVSAPVRLPDGRTAQKTLSIVLQPGDGQTSVPWMVTGFVIR